MMKKIFILIFFISAQAFSFEHESFAVVRSSNGKAKIEKVKIDDLISANSFDGQYFKIVVSKSNEAVSFSSEKDLLLKATTVYYHLSKARDYFVHVLNSSYVKAHKKVIVRLDLTNEFNELGHFAHDNKNPQYNNALTIPSGVGLPSRGIEPWDTEIWFRPAKVISRKDVDFKTPDASMRSILESFRTQTHVSSISRFLATLINNASSINVENFFRTFGASLIIELGYQTMDDLVNLFGRKKFHLESSLVPEIIYHEYSHVALSDYLELSHSTPVIEGMADIFASEIGKTAKLALKIKKYNTFSGKNAKRKQAYSSQHETLAYANSDFVFGLLYNMKPILGENSPKFFYEMRKKITTNSSIKNELIESTISTCNEMCDNPFIQKLELMKLFNRKKI